MNPTNNNSALNELTTVLFQAESMLEQLPKIAQTDELIVAHARFCKQIEQAANDFIGCIQHSLTPDETTIRSMLSQPEGLSQLQQIMQALLPADGASPIMGHASAADSYSHQPTQDAALSALAASEMPPAQEMSGHPYTPPAADAAALPQPIQEWSPQAEAAPAEGTYGEMTQPATQEYAPYPAAPTPLAEPMQMQPDAGYAQDTQQAEAVPAEGAVDTHLQAWPTQQYAAQ